MALKVDICKAFDTISWDFVLEVLETFGFVQLSEIGLLLFLSL